MNNNHNNEYTPTHDELAFIDKATNIGLWASIVLLAVILYLLWTTSQYAN